MRYKPSYGDKFRETEKRKREEERIRNRSEQPAPPKDQTPPRGNGATKQIPNAARDGREI